MTIVCCWLDDSFGRSRITAVADARVAREIATGKWTPLNDTTSKLFRVPVACFAKFDCSVGTWVDPYYTTELGLGFAGYCLEAMSIAALYRQVVERLAVVDSTGAARPRPEPREFVNLLMEITRRYFAMHAADLPVEFLLFGYSAEHRKPWIAQIEKKKGFEPELKYVTYDFSVEDGIWSIGDVGTAAPFTAGVVDLRRRVRKHQDGLKPNSSVLEYEHDLELARHRTALLKGTEIKIQEELENEFNKTVGGVLQKMEIYPQADGGAIGVISRDNRSHILDGIAPLAPGLQFVPIVGNMGKITEPPSQSPPFE
jgi:hypothetical protein